MGPTGRLRIVLAGGVCALAATASVTPAAAQERIAVDRWLVSTPFPADGEQPLTQDYLSGPGEAGVLPDRGRTVAGADWKLVREDSTWVFPLPTELQTDTDPAADETSHPVVAYAHAYIRAPADRTVRLLWGGRECTRVSAWLNGRRLDDLGRPADGDESAAVNLREAVVRIGFGYNTLLVKALEGDCAFGLTAGLEAMNQGSLEGIRVQATRPYGDTRTGPEPWILTGPNAGPEAILAWRGRRLFGAAVIRLSAFSVTAVESVRLEARVARRKVQRSVEWLEPAELRTVLLPFEFGDLREAGVRDEGLELQLKWDDEEWKGVLSMQPSSLLEAFRSSIRLVGWSGPRGAGDTGANKAEGGEPDPLANTLPLPGSGDVLSGDWEVPGWLSGFTLRLETSGSPGTYRTNGHSAEGDRVFLCRECRKGETVRLEVEATGGWTAFPSVVIENAGSARNGSGMTDAEARPWLEAIDEKGSRGYRERAAEATLRDNN